MAQWFKINPIQAQAGARRLFTNPVSCATRGNAVIAYPDGRAYLGETIKHRNSSGKAETWVEAFALAGDNPCPAPDNWRDYIIEELDRP